MYNSAIIGFIYGIVVLILELFILQKIYSYRQKSTQRENQRIQIREGKDIIEEEIEQEDC